MLAYLLSIFSSLFAKAEQAESAIGEVQSLQETVRALQAKLAERQHDAHVSATGEERHLIEMIKSFESQLVALYDEKARSGISDLMEAADTIRALEEELHARRLEESTHTQPRAEALSVEPSPALEPCGSQRSESARVAELEEMVANMQLQLEELYREKEVFSDEREMILSMSAQLAALYAEREQASTANTNQSDAQQHSSADEYHVLQQRLIALEQLADTLRDRLKRIAQLALQDEISKE